MVRVKREPATPSKDSYSEAAEDGTSETDGTVAVSVLCTDLIVPQFKCLASGY